MTSYDFTGGGPPWAPVYTMSGQPQQSLLAPVSQLPPPPPPPLQSPWDHNSAYRLTVRQQPERAKAANAKDKDRKPVDPPPILQLDVDPSQDPLQVYITSPYLFVQTFLIGASDADPEPELNSLTGNTCTSGHVVKDDRGIHNMMFCLNDISVKKEGTFRLKFCLFKLNTTTGDVENLTSTCSQPFTTYSGRHFPGMSESTSMTRLLVDAGVRLRLRKESKAMSTKKKNNAFAQMMSRRGTTTTTAGAGGDHDGDHDRPLKRMRSEPHDKDALASGLKHGGFSSSAPPHAYAHATAHASTFSPGGGGGGGGGGFHHGATAAPGQTIMAPMLPMSAGGGGGSGGGLQLGLETQNVSPPPPSHHQYHQQHHSPPSAGSSYHQSPGRGQSPSAGYALPQGLVPGGASHASALAQQFGGGGGGGGGSGGGGSHTAVDIVGGSAHGGSSSPDLNYTTTSATNYSRGGYMPSHVGGGGGGNGGGARALPGIMQQRHGSLGLMPMRLGLGLQNGGHGAYGESGLFEYGGGYGLRDGHGH